MKPKIILTCEHGGLKGLKGDPSHKAYDFGAAEICKFFQRKSGFDVHINFYNRQLVDMNRALQAQKNIAPAMAEAYLKYREGIWQAVRESIKNEKNFYVFSVHSFTAIFKGKKRKTDIGLLYRTTKKKELSTAKSLRKHLEKSASLGSYKTHFNLPYRGHTDCLLNDLLNQFGRSSYFKGGCFLEFNQKLLKSKASSVNVELASYFRSLG